MNELTYFFHLLLFRWLSTLVVKVLDLKLEGCEFNSRPWCCRVTILGKLFTPADRNGLAMAV